MKQVDLEPHEFRQRGKPRMWSTKRVIHLAVAVLVVEAVAVLVLLGRPDLIDAQTLAVVAIITWPWMVALGAAVGYLVPHFIFSDDPANERHPSR